MRYSKMSTSNTLRFYVNNKRISTAVRVKDCYILQVYPRHQRFANEEDWRSYWEMHQMCKPVIRVEGGMSLVSTQTQATKQKGFRCVVCLLDGTFDHRNCIVLKYKGNVTDWEAASVEHRKELQADVAAKAAEPKPKSNTWICPACNKGPGNDHRMCICRYFNYSVQAWEEACGIRQVSREEEEQEEVVQPASSSSPASSNLSEWTHKAGPTHTFPPGKYFIGDLCYALPDEIYENIFGGMGYEDGLYTQKDSNHFFFVASTSFGDGCYEGSDGKEFGVDAGVLSILPAATMDKNDGGHMYDFQYPVTCTFRDGKFKFSSGTTQLTIKT